MMSTDMLGKALAGAAMGTVVGGTLGVLRAFFARPGYAERLTPKPECFHMDESVAKAFFDISAFRALDEQSYQESLHNADSLLCLVEQLLRGEVKPQITDPGTATSYAVRSLTHLRTLRDKTQDEATYSEIANHIKSVEIAFSNHLSNVTKICKNATQ